MNVLLLGAYPPPHGGLQSHLAALRQHLVDCGHAVEVINLQRTTAPPESGVFCPRTGAAVAKLIYTRPADILHIHLGGNLTPRLLGLCFACAMRPASRSLLTFHSGGYPSSPEGQSARPATLRGFVFRRLDGLIAVNQQIHDLFLRFGVAANRVRTIAPHAPLAGVPGVDLPPQIASFRARHEVMLLTVGLLEPEYDLAMQVDMLGVLRERMPNAGLMIVGSGSLEASLRAHIASKPYAEHVLLCGDVPHAATLRAIAECSVLLRTTLYDGDSVAVREALQLGTPVIATDNGMRPPGVHLVPVHDPDKLRERIAAVLSAPRGSAAVAANQADRNMESVVEFYLELTRQ